MSSRTNVSASVASTPQPPSDANDFDRFVYLLSHDVRNALRALVEIPHWIEADLIEEGHEITGPLGEHLRLLNTNAGRVDRMLVDLLTHSRVGRMQTVGPVNLADTISIVLSQMRLPPGFVVTQDLQMTTVHMGEQDAFTLFSTLISNCVKHHHTQAGKIAISTLQRGDTCVIRIQDDGPGIPKEHHDRIFELMTTLKPRDEVEGSGMGLAIVKKIALLYDGDVVCAMPTSGVGTLIEVRLKA